MPNNNDNNYDLMYDTIMTLQTVKEKLDVEIIPLLNDLRGTYDKLGGNHKYTCNLWYQFLSDLCHKAYDISDKIDNLIEPNLFEPDEDKPWE